MCIQGNLPNFVPKSRILFPICSQIGEARMSKARIFTAPFVESAPPGEHFDAKEGGLGLRVSPKGKRAWFFRFRTPDKRQKRESLGAFPDVTLKDARRRAVVRRGEVAEGRWTPPEAGAVEEALTFGAVARQALDLMADTTRPRTVEERERILQKDLLPRWGNRPAEDISRADVAKLAKEIKAPIMANRVLSLVRSIFNAGIDLELVATNPAARLKRFLRQEEPRSRLLTADELKKILGAMEVEGPGGRAFFGLVAYTAQRAGAVGLARWKEFDLEAGTWTIPAEDGRKFKKYPRLVPLNKGALDALTILREVGVRGEYLFPSRNGCKAPTWTNRGNLTRRLRKESKVDGWNLHDIRTAFRTLATRELGIRADTADAVLGHAISSVGFTHYEADKSTYLLPEKREALEAWGKYLEGLKK